MSDSPVLREASDFAGEWRVTGDGGPCRVVLAAARIESANAHTLTDAENCLPRLLGRPVAGWRPATDGIDFAGPDRLSAGFFSFQGDGSATLARSGRPVLTLSRG